MNKQIYGRIGIEEKKSWFKSIFLPVGLIVGFLLTAVLISANIAQAQSSSITLKGGETVDLVCDGRGFSIERVSRTNSTFTCQAGPGSGNPQPTQPPVEPTEPPVEPTEPAPQPTEPAPQPTEPAPPTDPTPVAGACNTTTGFIPLIDLGTGMHQGHQGGLYPGGSNQAPAEWTSRAMANVSNINADQEFVMLSVGMSNTMREFEDFQDVAASYSSVNPNMRIINGAKASQDSVAISDPNNPYWDGIDSQLGAIRLGPEDVRIIWLKEAHARPELPFPEDAKQLQSELNTIIDIINGRYPNVEVIYLSSRIYAGYATNDLNPEPWAYQSGFAVKWTIEQRMSDPNYDGAALLWGPYMWADGTNPRSDGLTWVCDDYKNDMTHPSPQGELKVANLLLDFFSTDETAVWFRK